MPSIYSKASKANVIRQFALGGLTGMVLLSATSVSAQDGNFRYVPVPIPGGSIGTGINIAGQATPSLNDNGVLVGRILNSGTGASPAFYSINGATPVQINNVTANGQMRGVAINNNNLIVGVEGFNATSNVNPWYYKIGVTGTATLMTAPPSNTGDPNGTGLPNTPIIQYEFATNANNIVVANVATGSAQRAFRWDPVGGNALPTGSPTAIGPIAPNGANTGAVSLNNNNIAGGLGQSGAFAIPTRLDLTTPASSVNVTTNGFGQGRVTSINDSGIMVGRERLVSGGPIFPVRYQVGSAPTAIPGFSAEAPGGATYTAGSGPSLANISTNNLLTFSLNVGSGANQAAIFSNLTPTTSYNLNTLAASGFALSGNLTDAVINKNGQIGGQIDTGSGQAVLGTPELNWRNGLTGGSGNSGNWDDVNGWSWGVTPGTMHPLLINRAAAGSLTVTLDGSNKQVAELAIGTSGSGASTLQVTGRTLRVTNNDASTFGNYSTWATGISTIGASGTVSLTGATLQADQGLAVSGAIVSQASGTTSVIQGGTLNLNAGNRTVTVSDGAAAVDLNIANNISNGGLVKAGLGTLQLSGTSSYTGTTQVNAGVLQVTGSLGNTATTVANGATLIGTGSIGGNVSIANGGTLSPGLSPGTLTVGSLTMTTGAILTTELSSSVLFDRIVVGAGTTTTLNNATLNGVRLGGFVAPFGTAFVIIDNPSGGSVTGTFNGLPEGADFFFDGQGFEIHYNVGTFSVNGGTFTTLTAGGDVVIVAIPEPSTIAFIGLLGVTGAGLWYKRKVIVARAMQRKFRRLGR